MAPAAGRVGPRVMVNLFFRAVHLSDLSERFRPIDWDPVIVIGAVIAFREAMAIGPVGRTDRGVSPQTSQEADQGGRKIVAGGPGPEARVPIDGDLPRTTSLRQPRGHGSAAGFGVKVRPSRIIHQNRGPPILGRQGFDPRRAFVRPLVRFDGGPILEIDL